MLASDFCLCHVGGNRMAAIAGQAINARPNQEMGSDLLCRAKDFIDVALSVADMNAAHRITQCRRGIPEVFQPTDAPFFSMGTRVGLIFFFRASQPLNFFRFQNLIAVKPSGRPWALRPSWNASKFHRSYGFEDVRALPDGCSPCV